MEQEETIEASEKEDTNIKKLLAEQETKLKKEHAKALAEAIKKAKSEGEKLAKMSSDEKLKAELEEKKQTILLKEQELNHKELKLKATKMLSEKGMPSEFLDYLVGSDEESTLKRIEVFKKAYDEAVNNAVNEKLKGTTPKGSGDNGKVTISKNGFFETIYKAQAKRS